MCLLGKRICEVIARIRVRKGTTCSKNFNFELELLTSDESVIKVAMDTAYDDAKRWLLAIPWKERLLSGQGATEVKR